LDEAITPAVNNYTGYFEQSYDDAGISPLWTEPFWSNDVGVKMYRVSKTNPGFISLAAAGIVVAVCFFVTVMVKVGMKKEKLY
jgi:nicastrin